MVRKISTDKLKLCAENITKSVNIKKEGEFVLIKGAVYCQELLEEIGLSVLRKGGIPYITAVSDYFEEIMWQDDQISEKTLEIPPKHYIEMVKNIDAYIVIEYPEDPLIRNNAPEEKLKAYQKSIAPIRDILYGLKEEYTPGKKWCYAAWPSKKAADFYNIDYDLFEKFIVDGMSIPSEELTKITTNLGKYFDNAKKVYVTDDLGTNFWVSIENRAQNIDDGLLSDEKVALGDLGGNLPAGEVFFPPNEKQGEGKLFCPLTIERYSNKILKNIDLTFKNGKLLINKISADNDLDLLINAFKQSEEIDKKNNVPELRTYNVGELGIGCNPVITKPIGYILTDEKINGSVHVAFGFNKSFGGTSASQMHWDFVTAPRANITVEYVDGSKKVIMENGKLIGS
ncbi:MAG: aminopeptidase [Candidatus Lokiarchaeia archaeon]|nr:aminopeptidase [Candidatus Lokiarchaeia archaeon]